MAHVKLKGNPIALKGDVLKVGFKAPGFTLVDKDLNNCSLMDFEGKKKLLSIVPSLDTEVCLISSKKFNEAAKAHPEIAVLIVSTDLPFAQKRVCGLEKLGNIHTLSMMRDKSFAHDYGVLIAEGPLAGVCTRAVFVLDERDKVLYAEVVDEITKEPNYAKALAALGS